MPTLIVPNVLRRPAPLLTTVIKAHYVDVVYPVCLGAVNKRVSAVPKYVYAIGFRVGTLHASTGSPSLPPSSRSLTNASLA